MNINQLQFAAKEVLQEIAEGEDCGNEKVAELAIKILELSLTDDQRQLAFLKGGMLEKGVCELWNESLKSRTPEGVNSELL